MNTPPPPPRAKCLCLDIEIAPRQDRLVLREIGAWRPDTNEGGRMSGKNRDWPAWLDRLCEGAAFVLGHNITAFDRPKLQALHGALALFKLPVIDTLELSPIAFPQNPYHRLVKDYKLCATTRNDPQQDARLAYELFLDQTEALRARVAQHPHEALCLHYLLVPEDGNKGLASFFARLRQQPRRPTLDEARAAWWQVSEGKVCQQAARDVRDELLRQPEWFKPLAYAIAWLRVAGGNSVLPPWVYHQFPRAREIITRLRDAPCADPGCEWCRTQHDPRALLRHYFQPITDFRATPTTPDGHSLQEAITCNVFARTPTLAILPTGGGKSLCYQLPALARFYRTSALTVIISPLQSLMKDQVDGMVKRGIECAGYLNGMLSALERKDMLDKLRLGDLGMLFVAPEQFRSRSFLNAIRHREIAAWVFDEAHCLSKWGHDFRPDYLYVAQCIRREIQPQQPAPAFCFTATAKQDVMDDICTHLREKLGMELVRLEGGVRRDNLDYQVRPVARNDKYAAVLELLREAQRDDESAIIFCARQRTTEELADYLTRAGIECDYFHGGREPEEKRKVQDNFINSEEAAFIAATNAFGMGVDKDNVRLVIHLDTPGSLENYLQEAGRAGRDQKPARCILLYDEADMDVQFRLLKNARLTQHDIQSILKALRQIHRKDRHNKDDDSREVVATSGEILLEIPEQTRIDPDAHGADTKVRVAIAALEDARLLERKENHVCIFPGSLRVDSLDSAREKLLQQPALRDQDNSNLQPYLDILSALFQADEDRGVTTDELMLASGADSVRVRQMLHELDTWQILDNDIEIGVTFYRQPPTAERLERLCAQEQALLKNMREHAPDADRHHWQSLNLRKLCHQIRHDTGQQDFSPDTLARLLKSFAEAFDDDDTGNSRHPPFIEMRPRGPDERDIRVLRGWAQIEDLSRRRLAFCRALVAEFARRRQGNNLLVTAKRGELEAALRDDVALQAHEFRDWERVFNASLIHLNTNEVLHLARGKAVFRSAMTIELSAESRRLFNKENFLPLKLYYDSKIAQVHVMGEYARLALQKMQSALCLVEDYFKLNAAEFARRYFAGERKDLLALATSEESHRRILLDLKNPAQEAIVAADPAQNQLILAGPGSGKTRVIVHRVAWLLRECLVPSEEIMVLAYNRAAALEVRRRLWALVGVDAVGVVIQTVHALALRITGTSFAAAHEYGEEIQFNEVIPRATALLQQAAEARDEDGEVLSLRRDRALAGCRYLLIDEYQDINHAAYELISAFAGKALASEQDRLRILAVGDDDQNIYAFNHTDVRFIRHFEADYHAQRALLVENYRSTAHIIAAANALIAPAAGRMKADKPICINHLRKDDPAGGTFGANDPVTGGRVHLLELPADANLAAQLVFSEIERLHALPDPDGAPAWSRFAVIARQWQDLAALYVLCRLRNVPVRLLNEEQFTPALHATREGAALLALLRGAHRRNPRRRLLRPATLSRWFRRRYRAEVKSYIEHPQRAALASFIVALEDSAPRSERLIDQVIESLYEFGSGKKHIDPGVQGSMLLLTAHRAKGLEFDHVVLLDNGKWQNNRDDERRLYYVAMTRARKTLTLCTHSGVPHAFAESVAPLCLRSAPAPAGERLPALDCVLQRTEPKEVILSWPAYKNNAAARRRIARLEVGDELRLHAPRSAAEKWNLYDTQGGIVGKMSQHFQPPAGEILAVRVAAILVHKENDTARTEVPECEVVLPEILYRPTPPATP